MSSYSFFGASVAAVLRRLPGAVVSDFAQHRPVVQAGSTAQVVQADSTAGLAAGDAVHVGTGAFPPPGETRLIQSIDSATQLTLADALSREPVSGDVLDDGPAVIEAALADAEALIEAHLPDRPRRLLRRVEGEVVVPAATDGQATAPLALPVASALVLYADYLGDYADRAPDDAMDPSAYSLGGDGATITFAPPLSRGTRIVADYDHTLAGGVAVLADLAAELAAARLARVLLAHQPEWVEALAAGAQERLAALAAGRCGLPELDAVRLYEDWERAPRGTRAGALERR